MTMEKETQLLIGTTCVILAVLLACKSTMGVVFVLFVAACAFLMVKG